MNRTSIYDIPTRLDTTKKIDTIFLRQVATGKHLTLFYYGDNVKSRFFIAETNSVPIELKYDQYYDKDRQVIAKTIYKGQLLIYANNYLPGDARLRSKIEIAEYDQSSFETIVNKINGDNETSVRGKKQSTRMFIGVAANRTTTEVNEVDYSNKLEHSTTVSPKINFGFDIFANPMCRGLFLGQRRHFHTLLQDIIIR